MKLSLIPIIGVQILIVIRILKNNQNLNFIDYIAIPIQLFCTMLIMLNIGEVFFLLFAFILSISTICSRITINILLNLVWEKTILKHKYTYILFNLINFVLLFIPIALVAL